MKMIKWGTGCTLAVAAASLLYTNISVSKPGLQSDAVAAKAVASTDVMSKEVVGSDSSYAVARADIEKSVSQRILKILSNKHFRQLPLDDTFSQRLLENYIKDLDFNRIHFLQADINDFQQYRHLQDDWLKSGNLDAGYAIYNRLLERRAQRLKYMSETIAKGVDQFDFDQDDVLQIDRKNSAWLKDEAEAEALWASYVKNDALNLMLGDKPPKNIAKTLKKRYDYQLNRLKQITSFDVVDAYLDAVTKLYDPHTEYFPPRDSENFDIHMKLEFQGIGAHLQSEEEYVKIIRLIKGGPAEQSRALAPADRIVGVAKDKKSPMVDVIGWRIDDVVDLIRGKKGTPVRLEILPADAVEGMTKQITLVRDTIKLEEQAAKKKVIDLSDEQQTFKVGVITLPTFYMDFDAYRKRDPNYRSTTRDVARLIHELRKEDVDALVLDLRANGGGALPEAINLTGLFIPKGPVVQVRDAYGDKEVYADEDERIFYTGPLAVLVDRLSASASEIFAGAIQDTNRGIIVGNQTYGKGTVQTLDDSLASGELKYTQAMFYRITGSSTQHRGVIPNITFPALIDKEEIGESSYDDSLPWQQITPAKYQVFGDLGLVMDKLKREHEARVKEDVEFKVLEERAAFVTANRSKKALSLNMKQRQQEKRAFEAELLALENRKRTLEGSKPYKTFKAYEDARFNEPDEEVVDAYLRETGRILQDYASLVEETQRISVAQ